MSVIGNINTRQSSIPFTVPPPVGGLNGRDPLADMDPRDAYFMDNVYPQVSKVVARNGNAKHTNAALSGPVESLEVYTGATGEVMLAWAGTNAYNVSAAAPVVLDAAVGEPFVITAMFSNAADNAQHMIIVNGTDTPKRFDGATIAALAMTGIADPTDLNFVFTFKSRLYFGAEGKLGFYYLPVCQIQGALSYFDLGQVSKLGGNLVAIASYSQGGETPNDYIIFITSRGELIVYNGTDPSSAADWVLIGRYFAASPIGKRCAFNFNGELIIITLDGAMPFSQIRTAGDSDSQGVVTSKYGAITTKLGRFLSDFNVNANVQGWQGLQYPRGGFLLINVPATSSIAGDYYHYVMNANTGSWCRFRDWNGMCFTVFNDRLYFGRFDGYVMLADEGSLDDTVDININVKQAYNYFNSNNDIGNIVKHFQWAEVFIASNGQPPLSGAFAVNFNEMQPDYIAGIDEAEGATWDTATWDLATWGGDNTQQRALITLNRGGFNGSLWLRASLSNITFEWFATQYVLQKTSGLLI